LTVDQAEVRIGVLKQAAVTIMVEDRQAMAETA
jgi:hypothetical protein